jgi:hypothetical protein
MKGIHAAAARCDRLPGFCTSWKLPQEFRFDNLLPTLLLAGDSTRAVPVNRTLQVYLLIRGEGTEEGARSSVAVISIRNLLGAAENFFPVPRVRFPGGPASELSGRSWSVYAKETA